MTSRSASPAAADTAASRRRDSAGGRPRLRAALQCRRRELNDQFLTSQTSYPTLTRPSPLVSFPQTHSPHHETNFLRHGEAAATATRVSKTPTDRRPPMVRTRTKACPCPAPLEPHLPVFLQPFRSRAGDGGSSSGVAVSTPVEQTQHLAPTGDYGKLLACRLTPSSRADSVLLVGHEPNLSTRSALLCTGRHT